MTMYKYHIMALETQLNICYMAFALTAPMETMRWWGNLQISLGGGGGVEGRNMNCCPVSDCL